MIWAETKKRLMKQMENHMEGERNWQRWCWHLSLPGAAGQMTKGKCFLTLTLHTEYKTIVWDTIVFFFTIQNFCFEYDTTNFVWILYHFQNEIWCNHFSSFNSRQTDIEIELAKLRQSEQFCCPNWPMYLSKLQNVFVQISKSICPNCKMYLSKFQNVFV